MSNETSLYESLGGAPAVEAAVDLFYRKVLRDDALAPFFEAVNMEEQRSKQRAFLTMAFGGPNTYTGLELRKAHAPLVAKGMGEEHFERVVLHLAGSLEELGITPELIHEVAEIAESVRKDVLNG